MIERALKRDDGTYMCVAVNAAGVRRAVAAVRVTGYRCFLNLFRHFNFVIILKLLADFLVLKSCHP